MYYKYVLVDVYSRKINKKKTIKQSTYDPLPSHIYTHNDDDYDYDDDRRYFSFRQFFPQQQQKNISFSSSKWIYRSCTYSMCMKKQFVESWEQMTFRINKNLFKLEFI